MLRVITIVFAVIGVLAVLIVSLGIYTATYFAERPAPEPKNVILSLDFDKPISETSSVLPTGFSLNEKRDTLLSILEAIDHAKTDPHVKGIVAHFGTTQPKLAEAEEIRDAIKSFRGSKKFTYAFGTTYGDFGQGNRSYYLASAFENIWLQPVGAVSLTGLAMQSPFGKAALDSIGVKADFMQREEYKSFMDMATRDDFAPPVRQNLQALLDDLSVQIASGIAESRGFDVAHVNDLMARGPFTDEEAQTEKLVTKLGYADELDDEIKKVAGDDVKSLELDEYMEFVGRDNPTPKAKVAVIYGTGMIMDHDDNAPSITGNIVMGADTIANAFGDAADNKDIKAILFRVDSPGGTPEASETIRRAMMHAQKAGKPVLVSMGDTAASGGYWISMNADRIIAEPCTITGSIGVLAGKFTVGGLLKKLGISMGTLQTAENAGMNSPSEEFTPKQRERMNALLDASYKTFITDVSQARKIPIEKMPDIAKGRVWTGAQASKIGLVDELGGFATTLAAIRKQLKLAETDQVALEFYPAPESPFERVMKLMKTFGAEEAVIRPFMATLPFLKSLIASPHMAESPISAANIR